MYNNIQGLTDTHVINPLRVSHHTVQQYRASLTCKKGL